jgi:BON domain
MRPCITSNGESDAVLAERVWSQLGGLVSHPSAIEVRAEQGRVILSGPILRDEIDRLLHGVASVRGVHDVENRLQVHATPGNVPSLQRQPTRRLSGQQWDVMQVHWSPATRLLMGTAGGAMAKFGAGRRDTLGGALTLTCLTLLTRALTNMELKRMLGVGAGRRAIDIQKTINLNAPVDRVFRQWANYQNSHTSCPMCERSRPRRRPIPLDRV